MRLSMWMAGTVCLATLSPASSPAAIDYEYLKSLGWTLGNTETLEAEIPDADAATELVRALRDGTEPLPTVGEYLFAQPFGTGETVLFATIDYSGRGFFAFVAFVREVDGELVWTEINPESAIQIESLAERVIDLDQDGLSEVLIPRPLADRSAERPTPFFVDVYSWDGSAYEEANRRFESYYRDVLLPETEAKRARSQQKAAADEREAAMQWKHQTEVDAIHAFLAAPVNPER